MVAFLIAASTCVGMKKCFFAVFQSLAFHAVSAHGSSGNDQPLGVPFLNTSFDVHNPIP
jgi:hypothetical protein